MRPSLSPRLLPLLALALAAAASSASATVFSVTTTADSGVGSFRQAVTDASGSAGPHTINFNIAGSGTHSIALATDLPTIIVAEGLVIDGTTQPGYAGTPLIEIHRDDTNAICLNFSFTPATVKALAINRCGTAISAGNGGALTLLGSRIGTDPAGTVALPNFTGVSLVNGVANTIGGPLAADRNILSGNTGNALNLGFGGTATIRGNSIGVDATGGAALGNGVGITCLNVNNVVIGGSGAGDGNVISGNTGPGVTLGNCDAAIIRGNFVGTNAAGTAAIPNNKGLEINVSDNPMVGGPAPADGNLLSGNTLEGVRLTFSNGATVQSNLVGTDVTGDNPLGNGVGIDLNGEGTLAGTATPGGPGANVVAFNLIGVRSSNGTGNLLRGNAIHDNKFLGFDIGGDGVTANDDGDGDNVRPNFPNIASAVPEGNGVRIIGSLDALPAATFELDFYANPACSPLPQEYLEGERWLGTSQVTTDGSGHATFNVLLLAVPFEAGLRVTSTATGTQGTSEFSQRIVLASAPLTGVPTGTQLTIQGMQFEAGSTVSVGGVPATNVQFQGEYLLNAQAPALPPGSINNLTVTTPSGLSGTLPNAYVSLFSDVDPGNGFRAFIGGLVANGLTAGCGGPNYCPTNPVTRQQMAVFLLRGKYGLCYTPPACTGTVFGDVACAGNGFAPWIEALAALSITGGCGNGNYCPTTAVNRQQMAVFLLKAVEGAAYVPPACSVATFDDVPCSNPFSAWIYELAARGITGGCGGPNYCPANPVNRQQMAAFLVNTFHLPF